MIDDELKDEINRFGLGKMEKYSYPNSNLVNGSLTSYSSAFSQTINESTIEKARASLVVGKEALEKSVASNKLIFENNKKIVELIKNIVEHFGIPSSTSQYKSKKAGYVTTYLPWYKDLVTYLSSPKEPSLAYNILTLEKAIEKHLADVKIKESRDRVEEDRKLRTASKIEFLVENPEFVTQQWVTLKDAIVGVNSCAMAPRSTSYILLKWKYLYLAHYLQMNRGDWSEGHKYADIGLNNFIIESEQDSEIASDLNSYINEWDGDGRVFRDCVWNYDKIFKLVDPELLSLYDRANQLGFIENGY